MLRETLSRIQKSIRKSSRHRRNPGFRRTAPLLDVLEDRLLLTTAVWDGGGSDNKWTTPENWLNDIAPSANDDLIFPVGGLQKTNINDFPVGTGFGAMLLVGGDYSLSGNQLLLSGSVTSSASK